MRTVAQSSYCPSRTCFRPAMREMVALFFPIPLSSPCPFPPLLVCSGVPPLPPSKMHTCYSAPHVRTRATPLSRRVSVSMVVQPVPCRLPRLRIHRRTTATTWARGLSPPRRMARRAPPSAIVGAYPTAQLHQARKVGSSARVAKQRTCCAHVVKTTAHGLHCATPRGRTRPRATDSACHLAQS